MKPLDKMKLSSLRKRIGPMSSAEAFELALQAEQFSRDCGPFDIAYEQFKRLQHQMEEYALLLEREQTTTA